MRIALDAMGTDLAPAPEVAGAIEALGAYDGDDVEIILVGDEDTIRAELGRHYDVPPQISVHHAPDRVTADDSPASVIRRKPDSSIVVGLKLHKEGHADAFVSAGSTGAVMDLIHELHDDGLQLVRDGPQEWSMRSRRGPLASSGEQMGRCESRRGAASRETR